MIAYDRLSQIIPPDQALANKALSVALSQISNIKETSLPGLASAYKNMASVANLNQISTLTTPLPPSVQSYYETRYQLGSGPGNTLVITDMIGTAAGIGFTDQFENATEIILSLQANGTLTVLSGIYGDIANSINGVYGDAFSGPVTIPSGPAAGTYLALFDGFGDIEITAAQTAVSGVGGSATGIGCIPAAQTAINNIIAANSTATNSLNSAFTSMAESIVSENEILNTANITLTDIVPTSSQYSESFMQSLFSYATNVEVNGPAQYLEAIANLADLGGQAIVAEMRQVRNNTVLTTVGIIPNNTVDPLVTPGAQVANLLPSTYTTQQAANLIVK
jgi:hypothetical protein